MVGTVKNDPVTGKATTAVPSSEEAARQAEAALADMPAEWAVNGDPKVGKTTNKGKSSSATETADRQIGDPPIPDTDDATSDGVSSLGSFTTVVSGGQGTISIDDLMPCLLQVMFDAIKDGRADAEIRDMMSGIALAAKKATLNKQSEAIKLGMDEAKEKADISMNAANSAMWMGIAMGAVQIGGAFATYEGSQQAASSSDKSAGSVATLVGSSLNGLNQVLGGLNSYQQNMSEHDKLMVDANSKSSLAKIAANDLTIEQNAAEKADQKAEDSLKNQREHIQALKDNFKKLLDMWSQMSQSAVNAYR